MSRNTKEEIKINITKKDKVYLSIILSLICVVAVVCVLVPRYFYLQQNTQPPTNNTTNNNSNNDSNNTAPPTTNNGDNSQYQDYYSTLVINIVKQAGMPYSTMTKHLDSNNILNVTGIGITQSQLQQLENLAQPIYNTLQEYISNNQPITAQLINSDDDLYTNIFTFSNLLNTIAES